MCDARYAGEVVDGGEAACVAVEVEVEVEGGEGEVKDGRNRPRRSQRQTTEEARVCLSERTGWASVRERNGNRNGDADGDGTG